MAIERIGVKADREFGEWLQRILGETHIIAGGAGFSMVKGHAVIGWQNECPIPCRPVTREQFVAAALGAWWPEDPEPEHPVFIRTSFRGSDNIIYSPNKIEVGCAVVSRKEIESILNYMNYLRDKIYRQKISKYTGVRP